MLELLRTSKKEIELHNVSQNYSEIIALGKLKVKLPTKSSCLLEDHWGVITRLTDEVFEFSARFEMSKVDSKDVNRTMEENCDFYIVHKKGERIIYPFYNVELDLGDIDRWHVLKKCIPEKSAGYFRFERFEYEKELREIEIIHERAIRKARKKRDEFKMKFEKERKEKGENIIYTEERMIYLEQEYERRKDEVNVDPEIVKYKEKRKEYEKLKNQAEDEFNKEEERIEKERKKLWSKNEKEAEPFLKELSIYYQEVIREIIATMQSDYGLKIDKYNSKQC